MTAQTPPPRRHVHSHMWLMGVLGIVAGLVLLVFVPSLGAVSNSLFLFAGFHVVGGIVLLASLYVSALRTPLRRLTGAAKRHQRGESFDFGWGPGWMNGLAIAGLVTAAGAVALQVAAPGLWPLAFALVAATALFVVGNLVMRSFRRRDHVVLPMVDLLSGDDDLVLDAGCGTGRTTIGLGRVLKTGRVVAFDRFDASYIDEGGRALLDRNLKLAGLTDRVMVEAGDLTAMRFADNHFDAAVSTHVYDHLGDQKARVLAETLRVLKPGGRFLMAVWVPGWATFAVANLLSVFLTRKAAWRTLATAAGFEILDEGMFNNAWFVLLAKPRA